MDLEDTVTSLRREAEALGELQLRCARLRDGRERSHAQLDATAAAIDARIDACLRIAEHVAAGATGARRTGAGLELERHLRRLGILRAELLALYLASPDAHLQA